MMRYREYPVFASDAVARKVGGVTVEIGLPQIVAAKDDSPDEGTFVAPRLRRLGSSVLLNWSFDWDVVDADLPDKPNGRVSDDCGLTWRKQTALMPAGYMFQTSEREVACWFRGAFEIPGRPGVYKVPTWRSPDMGQTWSGVLWTEVAYPGTKGVDTYNPPEEYRRNDGNYLRGGVKAAPPAYLDPFFTEVSRLRPLTYYPIHPQAVDPEGALYSVTYGRYLRDTSDIVDWDRDYWRRLNWQRYAALAQTSRDHGRTWSFAGAVADGSDYEPRVDIRPGCLPNSEESFHIHSGRDVAPGLRSRVDFAPGDGFSEPSLVIFPDGEMLCALRTGSNKPLYCVRSYDRGRTWTDADLLSPRYVEPIRGVLPTLVLLKNGVLALCTGRPHCTVHFSKDRGRSWFLSETLFGGPPVPWRDAYTGSHCNNSMIAVDDNTLLYAHDATRPDPDAPNAWLRKAGHGLIILRRIEVRV